MRAGVAPDCIDEPVRIISTDREVSAISYGDRYGFKPRNIIQPAVRRQMNSPAIPPANANGLASDNFRKPNSFADNADTKRGTESLFVDRNPESVEQDEANQQDDRNDHRRLAMER